MKAKVCYLSSIKKGAENTRTVQTKDMFFHVLGDGQYELVFSDAGYFVHVPYSNIIWHSYLITKKIQLLKEEDFNGAYL